jgi:hypothetical protein
VARARCLGPRGSFSPLGRGLAAILADRAW